MNSSNNDFPSENSVSIEEYLATHSEHPSTQCGYVAILGRPNVGKSTLLNRLIHKKISITSRKPQTTRQSILGIRTEENHQIIYMDTPGLHQDAKQLANRQMNRAATDIIQDVDLILFMVDGIHWFPDDAWALKKITHVNVPVILLVNKIDQIKDRSILLPHLEKLAQEREFTEIVPLSAKSPTAVATLEEIILKYLPRRSFVFKADQSTNASDEFLASEIIREKLIRQLGQELPYVAKVEIEEFKEQNNNGKILLRISGLILVERPGQKMIIIGEHGARLKSIGEKARIDMEHLFGKKVFLRLWVKVT